jgi:hypothetical protein
MGVLEAAMKKMTVDHELRLVLSTQDHTQCGAQVSKALQGASPHSPLADKVNADIVVALDASMAARQQVLTPEEAALLKPDLKDRRTLAAEDREVNMPLARLLSYRAVAAVAAAKAASAVGSAPSVEMPATVAFTGLAASFIDRAGRAQKSDLTATVGGSFAVATAFMCEGKMDLRYAAPRNSAIGEAVARNRALLSVRPGVAALAAPLPSCARACL